MPEGLSGFEKTVYAATKKIPRGRVATYGAIARAICRPGAARAVGKALNKNPFAPKVPCHRVVKADGRVGGFAQGFLEKEKILKKEGIKIIKGKIKYLKDIILFFKIIKIKFINFLTNSAGKLQPPFCHSGPRSSFRFH